MTELLLDQTNSHKGQSGFLAIRVIEQARCLWRSLWVSRVSVFSVLLGYFLITSTPQTQDLFAEIKGSAADGVPYWLTFYFLVVVAWVLPVFFSSRIALKSYRAIEPNTGSLGTLWPRILPYVLAIGCVAAILLGQLSALANVHFVAQDSETTLSLFQRYFSQLSVVLSEMNQGDFLQRTISVDELSHRHMVTMPLVTVFVIVVLTATLYFLSRLQIPQHVLYLFAGGLTVLALIMTLNDPLVVTKTFHRALLLPILLGVWVPAVTYLGHQSHRIRAPLILFTFLALGGFSLVVDTQHDVRTLSGAEVSPRADLAEAVTTWRTANNCEEGEVESCPAPIIAVAAGGASRAAFFTGSVLGQILDESRRELGSRDFGQQLFAISAVSGGSLGAAAFVAALDGTSSGGSDSAGKVSPPPPCKKPTSGNPGGNASLRMWHAFLDIDPNRRYNKYHQSWKDCMQAILSGDFLSSSVVSLVFSDLPNVGTHGDRAKTLERAWERRYETITGKKTLEEAFLSHRFDPDRWRPILVLNGTSTQTGRRIVISPLKPTYFSHTQKAKLRLFNDSYDLHELLQHDATARETLFDIPLSTAAAMSARFPVVSPEGNIRGLAGRIVDRIVDGGYFENYGAVTALELAEKLSEFGLKPFILQITNDPEIASLNCVTSSNTDDVGPHVSEVPAGQVFQSMRAPLRGLFETRSARGRHAAVRLCNWVWRRQVVHTNDVQSKAKPRWFAHVRVYPTPKFVSQNQGSAAVSANEATDAGPGNRQGDFKQLSMSWWLSKSVQRYLDIQLPRHLATGRDKRDDINGSIIEAQQKNRSEIDKVLKALSAPSTQF